jgi:hypothetical protein
MKFLKRRLNERSTWGTLLPAILMLAGFNLAPDDIELVAAGAGVLLAAFSGVPDGPVIPPKE